MIEAHVLGVKEDEDIAEARKEKIENPSADQMLEQMKIRAAELLKKAPGMQNEETSEPDIDILYAKLCEDIMQKPIFGLLSKLADPEPNMPLILEDGPLNEGMCNIIKEILSNEKNFKFMVKKLILNRNFINDAGFAAIL